MTLSADYIVVGSGAGGGPLAVRLAEAGHTVLVIEAGGEASGLIYDVPIFHGHASESPDMSWNFYVHHYDDPTQAQRDRNYDPVRGGVLYPRAATIGGCTAHNAMITLYPNDADWDGIADLTGDESWRAAAMRPYFERLERCTYRSRWLARLRWIGRLSGAFDVRGHGFSGWLPTSIAKPTLIVNDRQMVRTVASAGKAAIERRSGGRLKRWQRWSRRWFDPNTAALQEKGSMLGLWQIPLSVGDGRRHGTREPLLKKAGEPGTTLRILSGRFVTRLLFDDDNRCTGVEFVTGNHLYGADPHADGTPAPPPETALARREVIVAGGAFNTPQLLKLSGIGPADELTEHGIPVRVDAPGVGANLQDRYEISVVTRLPDRIAMLKRGLFRPPLPGDLPDDLLAQWRDNRGPYATNGALLGLIAESAPTVRLPDLFLFALPADFQGYHIGYADLLTLNRNRLTWAILKAYNNNQAGTVRLQSANPFEPPEIRFRYFDEGSDSDGADLEAVVEGVMLARELTRKLAERRCRRRRAVEKWPGPDVQSRDQVRQFVRDHAWGHHACGTAAIGPDGAREAVLDSRFRVRGVTGLRVVDASIFPYIPGYFIATAIFMASEKAADVILADRQPTHDA